MTNFDDWLVGFADGDGSFFISIYNYSKLRYGIEVRPVFSVSQYDYDTLLRIQDFLGCGSIHPLYQKPGYCYSVTAINECLKLVDFFDAHPLLSKKLNDYKIWRECVFKIKSLEHRTLRGILEIAKLRDRMNIGIKASTNRLGFREIKEIIENKIGQKIEVIV